MLVKRYPVVIFDAFGTLFDVYSIAQTAETLFPSKGAELSLLWRQKQVEYSWLRAMSKRYKTFWEITEDALRFALQKMQLDGEELIPELMQAYGRLLAFADSKSTLKQLAAKGHRLGILTNGNRSMIDAVLKSAQMGEEFEHILTSDQVQTFKTMSVMYDLVPDTFGVSPEQVLFVSSNAWDAAAATWYGFDAYWVNRANLPFEVLDVKPAYAGDSLEKLLSL
jgi:2-haloacid dehalogenase